MKNFNKEIIAENENVRITRFTCSIEEDSEKLKNVMDFTQQVHAYALDTHNSFSIFTDVTTPNHLLLEEQLTN